MKHSLYRNKMGYKHKGDKSIRFYFDSKPYYAVSGDTIASALLCNGIYYAGYSKNYHRPLGGSNLPIYTGLVYVVDKKYGNLLVNPNDIEVSENLEIISSSKPSLWNKVRGNLSLDHLFVKNNSPYQHLPYVCKSDFIAQTFGIKTGLPYKIEENFEKQYHHTDMHIIGGGLAGLYASFIALSAGIKVVLSDKKSNIFPTKLVNPELHNLQIALYESVINHPNLTLLTETEILPISAGKDILGIRLPYGIQIDKLANFQSEIRVIRAKHHLIATGLIETGFLYGGCDKGGIFTPQSYRDYALNYGFSAKNNIILYTNNDNAYQFLDEMELSPHHLCAIIDTRSELSPLAERARQQGYSIYSDSIVTHIQGKNNPEAVFFQTIGPNRLVTTKSIECKLLIHSSGTMLDMNIYAKGAKDYLSFHIKEGYRDYHVQNTKLPDNVSVIGYGIGALTKKEILKRTYETLKNILQKHQVNVPFLDTTSEQITDEIPIALAKNFSQYDKRIMEKIFFPSDICMSDLREFYVKNSDIEKIISFFFDKKFLFEDVSSLMYLVDLISHEYNYTNDKKYELLFETYETLYLEGEVYELHKELLDISVISRLYPASCHFYRNEKLPISLNKRFAMPILNNGEADCTKWIQDIYKTIKTDYAIQDLSPTMSVYKVLGPDSLLFLEKISEVSVADLSVQTGRSFCVEYSKRILNFTLWHLSKHTYLLYTREANKKLVKSFFAKKSTEVSELKYAMCNMSEQYSAIEIFGKKAKTALQNIALTFSDTIEGDDIILSSCWIENIEILASSQIRSGLDNIVCFMPSDTMSLLLSRFLPQGSSILSHLYDESIDHIFSLEEGKATQDIDSRLYPDFTTIAMAIPLLSKDNLKKGYLLYETDNDDKPIGVLADVCYSPYHQKDMALIYLKGELSEWENRTLTIGAAQSNERFHVKVLAPNHIAEKETVYE